MAYTLKNGRVPPVTTGEGVLSCRGFEGPVTYELRGSIAGLRPGGAALRGALQAPGEVAEAAFRACDGHLKLSDGKTYKVTMVGHTTGSDTAYFELRL